MTGIAEFLDGYVGKQIPGGCDHCDAYQTIRRWPGIPVDDGPGAFQNLIHHDDWCPWWVQNQNRATRRAAHKRSKRRRRP